MFRIMVMNRPDTPEQRTDWLNKIDAAINDAGFTAGEVVLEYRHVRRQETYCAAVEVNNAINASEALQFANHLRGKFVTIRRRPRDQRNRYDGEYEQLSVMVSLMLENDRNSDTYGERAHSNDITRWTQQYV